LSTETTPAVRVRRMRPGELSAVMAIDAATWPEPLPEPEWREALESGWTCAVAVEGGAVVGCAMYRVNGEFIQLDKLAVRPDRQRRGVGSALLARLRRTLVKSGRSYISLWVRVDNAGAIRLYRKHDYRVLHTLRGHYGPGEDALVMLLEADE
jgi:ribosomal-protein-alanine N-acetyltransferase